MFTKLNEGERWLIVIIGIMLALDVMQEFGIDLVPYIVPPGALIGIGACIYMLRREVRR